MDLTDIIIHSQHYKADIIKHYEQWQVFHYTYPELFLNEVAELSKLLPEQILKFNDDYLLDDSVKIYRQIRNKFKDSIKGDKQILFYHYEPGLYLQQVSRGYKVGEFDDIGNSLVTGTNLSIKLIIVDGQEFMERYSMNNN